ncbi:thiol-activated cytolysin family protein [Pseudonocardia oroxyli]|uniref:Thiol-activated cytolysin n=1 Tax=Pseudonocardia oroxyli TaxID=366584 RepID=A0A1G7SZ31_PSEOR|nr:thiol-activated cytolysin family protein [Pseudonocardia oroxyli]SDG27679.1 Thiol-activated cytolysin [Pseudonocardia oroxyli]
MANRKFVKSNGPNIYLVDGDMMRLVPDYVTLHALDPRGWDAVKTDRITAPHPGPVSIVATGQPPAAAPAAQKQLSIGRPFPPMRDGTLWVLNDPPKVGGPVAYLAEGRKLRPVPDAQTLSVLPRDHAHPVEAADIDLLHADTIGRPLGVFDAALRVVDVDNYINSIGPLPYEPPGDTPVPGTDDVRIDLIDGVPMEVRRRRVRIAREVTNFVEISPIADVLWPGSAITGASVLPGALAPIGLHRSPGVITLTTDLTSGAQRSQSTRLETPDLASYVDALAKLLDDLKPYDAAAAVRFSLEQISSVEEAMVKTGLNLKGTGWGVDAKADLSNKLTRSTTFGTFSQVYYQVAFSPDGSPLQFFADDVTLPDVQLYAGPNNPPCYIATVTYGRMLTFLIDSAYSSAEAKAALNASWSAAVSGGANLDASAKAVLASSSVTAVVVGGSSGAAGAPIIDPANGLVPWIQSQIGIAADRPAAPIEYTVRYMAPPHNIVSVTRAADPIKIVDANVYGGREVLGTYQMGEGSGSAPFSTGITVNRGDQVIITATGQIWAGWIFIGKNGPEGLDGPPKPWYPLQPGKDSLDQNVDVRGSSLLAGFDNTNWFQVGSGRTFNVPTERDKAVLWLNINDDDLTNGNGTFDVTISVRRRVPTVNAAG